jgi:hypothetical protein
MRIAQFLGYGRLVCRIRIAVPWRYTQSRPGRRTQASAGPGNCREAGATLPGKEVESEDNDAVGAGKFIHEFSSEW